MERADTGSGTETGRSCDSGKGLTPKRPAWHQGHPPVLPLALVSELTPPAVVLNLSSYLRPGVRPLNTTWGGWKLLLATARWSLSVNMFHDCTWVMLGVRRRSWAGLPGAARVSRYVSTPPSAGSQEACRLCELPLWSSLRLDTTAGTEGKTMTGNRFNPSKTTRFPNIYL